MSIRKIHYPRTGEKKFIPLALLLISVLLITACSPASRVPVTGVSSVGNNAAPTNLSADSASKSTAPAPMATSPASSNANCDALFLANYHMGMALAMMVNLTPNTDYTAYTNPASPFYLDFKQIRSDLNTLATLPDPSAADALIVGKPSEAIIYFHQLADLAETDIKNQGKPFVDTNPGGVKLIGIDTPWQQHAAVFGVAMGNVCKNYTAPSDLFSSTSAVSTEPTQPGQVNDAAMATLAASGANMEATVNALTTAQPETTETPAP